MFGYIAINKAEMKFRDFDIYHAYYCGLCKDLKERYGRSGQITLSYDMTFLIIPLSGLCRRQKIQSVTVWHIHFRSMPHAPMRSHSTPQI